MSFALVVLWLFSRSEALKRWLRWLAQRALKAQRAYDVSQRFTTEQIHTQAHVSESAEIHSRTPWRIGANEEQFICALLYLAARSP